MNSHKTLTPKFGVVIFYLIGHFPRCFFKSSFSGLCTSARLQTSVLDVTWSPMSFDSPILLLSLTPSDFLVTSIGVNVELVTCLKKKKKRSRPFLSGSSTEIYQYFSTPKVSQNVDLARQGNSGRDVIQTN